MVAAAWIIGTIVTVARLLAAVTVPMTGDEAYYWEWSRRLAFGYADHPPAVAWTIAIFGWLGTHAWAVRLGFVTCGALAAIALAGAAATVAGDARAGAVAAIAFSLAPLCSVAFTAATPDGPYLLCWCAALYFAALAFRDDVPLWWVLLGMAIGGALLSRMLALALPAGLVLYSLLPERRWALRGSLWLALVIAAVVVSPFVVWNALHGWETIAFTFVHRQETTHGAASLARAGSLYLTALIAYSPGLWLAATYVLLRPTSALLESTALPLFVTLMVLAIFRPVEVYWALGPFASLCALIGVSYEDLAPRLRRVLAALCAGPAIAMIALLFAVAYAPGALYAAVANGTKLHLKNSGPFEIFTFAPLARDVKTIAHERDAVVMTDGYGFSSVLDFEAGVAPIVIGYDWQGRESRRWYGSAQRPANALFVDKEPLATRPDIANRLHAACARVEDAGERAYRVVRGVPARTYYLTECQGLAANGLKVLRWEVPG
jgi:4-amino-4-deoxy-L-arabinose transferase-like glycosyltransferase